MAEADAWLAQPRLLFVYPEREGVGSLGCTYRRRGMPESSPANGRFCSRRRPRRRPARLGFPEGLNCVDGIFGHVQEFDVAPIAQDFRNARACYTCHKRANAGSGRPKNRQCARNYSSFCYCLSYWRTSERRSVLTLMDLFQSAIGIPYQAARHQRAKRALYGPRQHSLGPSALRNVPKFSMSRIGSRSTHGLCWPSKKCSTL